MLDKIERRLGGFAIPHLTEILIFGQAAVWIASSAGLLDIENILLVPDLVLAGEYRRLFTFLLVPPQVNPVFLLFGWMFFYLTGSALESFWGEFRYNLFIFVAYLATVAVSFLVPGHIGTNAFIGTSVFLAFAYLYPDFVIYVFFIIPMKVKWLAALTWLIYAWGLLMGSWATRLYILASISNFILFFGRDLWLRIKSGGRAMAREAREVAKVKEPFHRCRVCGATEQSAPEKEFRYCSRCGGSPGYCSDHIRSHEHI